MTQRPTSPRVLLLGEDPRITLPVIRSLGRSGLDVHLAWAPPGDPMRRSRHLEAAHDLPGVDLVAELAELQRQYAFSLVIPVTEAATFAVQRARDRLPNGLPMYLLNERAFTVCFDKAATQALAEWLDVDVPRSRTVRADDHDPTGELAFPLAVKPLCSVDAADVRAKQFVRRADDPTALAALLQARPADERVVLQEWFAGEGVGVEFIASSGRPLRLFQHRRLHETLGYGSTYRESTAVDPRLGERVTRLLQALDYTGVGMAEFRRDPSSGRAVLLEINARFWGSLPLAVAAGADFPRHLYDLLVHGRRDFPQTHRVGVRARDLVNDARWTWRCLRGKTGDGADGWEMNPLSRAACLRHVGRGLVLRDHVDTFALDDPRPFAFELARLVRTAFKRR